MSDSDPLRRYIEAGIALTQLTRSRAEAIVKELVKAGEVQREHAQERVDDLLDRSRKGTGDMAATIRGEIAEQLSAMGFATKADLAALEARLTARFAAATGQPATGAGAAARTPAAKPAKAAGRKSAGGAARAAPATAPPGTAARKAASATKAAKGKGTGKAAAAPSGKAAKAARAVKVAPGKAAGAAKPPSRRSGSAPGADAG
jgi:polyhydroxyalkanoate synthesis regulator phasin